jgi:hypothetical protein
MRFIYEDETHTYYGNTWNQQYGLYIDESDRSISIDYIWVCLLKSDIPMIYPPNNDEPVDEMGYSIFSQPRRRRTVPGDSFVLSWPVASLG